MRIIAGHLKGRQLAAGRWPGLRPTSARLRETLFNLLARRIVGAHVLDGCAGSGALGIEALSRGAQHVTFVDQDLRAVRLIGKNLTRCGVSAGYAIIRAGMAEAVRRLAGRSFDIVLLDPPYGELHLGDLLNRAAGLVAPAGILAVEHARGSAVPTRAGGLELTRTVRSGDSCLSFFDFNADR